MLLAVVILLMAAERGVELAINRRNSAWLREQGAVWMGKDGFPLILASQVVLFAGTATEATLAPWAGTAWWTWPALLLLALAQVLRYWCIATLGRRWSIRVVTLPGAPRITGGPYRFLPHPNYLVVISEALLLPLAFGAWATLAIVVPLQAVALLRRIRLEEGALRQAEPADTNA